MKFPSIKNLALVSVLGFGMLASVHADEDETPLAEEMSTLSGSLKKLRKATTTEEKVGLVKEAQKATLKSLEYLPMIFKDIKDEAEKSKATADYKKLVGQSFVKLCELELAYLAGDEAKVEAINDELKNLKKEGHDKYTE